jgi:hypothetical protein
LSLCYFANSFLFPAIFAGSAFGFCTVGAKLISILAPLMAELSPPLPMIILIGLASLGAVLSLLLKATKAQ